MTKELDSLDYRNFLSLTPEQQRHFAAAGLKFNDKGSVGNFSGAVGSLAGSNVNEGWGDKFSRWFTPNDKGTSFGGQVLSGIGTGVNVASGLAGMYFQNKMAGLAKDKANMEKDAYNRQIRADQENEARLQRLAENVGNGAFYK